MANLAEGSRPEEPVAPPLDLHTFGPGCQLAPVAQPQHNGWLQDIPPSNAQFFYASVISIDDPLSSTARDTKQTEPPMRPFSQADNIALDTAWLHLASEKDRENHEAARCNRTPGPRLVKSSEHTLDIVVRNLAARHRLKHLHDVFSGQDAVTTVRATLQGAATSIPVCCDQLVLDVQVELQALFCPLAIRRQAALGVDKLLQRTMLLLDGVKRSRAGGSNSVLEPSGAPLSVASSLASGHALPPAAKSEPVPGSRCEVSRVVDNAESSFNSTAGPISVPAPIPSRIAGPDYGISGQPFLRADIPSNSPHRTAPVLPLRCAAGTERPNTNLPTDNTNREHQSDAQALHTSSPSRQPHPYVSASRECDQAEEAALRDEIQATTALLDNLKTSSEVTVGISRLHTVDLPGLQMKPIYWSPMNDIAIVQRATWFYRDTMTPLEVAVANQLESLYRELRPWSDTWKIEIRCAIDVGPVGEEKISQPLWPDVVRKPKAKAGKSHLEPNISSDKYCASHCHQGAASAVGTMESLAMSIVGTTAVGGTESASPLSTDTRSFANHHVIFKDGTSAFLLKPSLKPSAYYGRRPITKISKGITVGIPIIRGFDRHAWSSIYGQGSKESSSTKRPVPSATNRVTIDPNTDSLSCTACKIKEAENQISDLVLVIHGVGQKLAERVESFHFTHAVNGLRRAIGAELKTPLVQSIVREGHTGIMVLPVNWRHTLSLEDREGSRNSGNRDLLRSGSFELKDIEQTSIPAVRNIISDVMFDIPFYMSHHKPKMIFALIREANRVYRLWCRNNPGFSENGRVHLIGHSLGSAMAIEVLSKQPTVPPQIGPGLMPPPEINYFEFDTKNLFLLGSPAAFFLLLERGALVPRRGRQKPGIDSHDSFDSRVVGESGSFGCLAVDNIYNVLAKEDPIAYLLNGTIDTTYAASLKAAYVPSATVGFFSSIGQSLRGIVSGASPAARLADTTLSQPPILPSIARLPSQLELEVHDFTREEVAERKAYLLNDNGQIDYFLHSTGGPLEIQYLNMLSAHTSYWTNTDLIRMLCVEIGRRPGKAHTLPAMRATKSLKRMIPTASQT